MSPLLLCLRDTFFHQAKARGVCEKKVGACPSAGLGDRCLVGSMPAARSERLRCQMKDLLSWRNKQRQPQTESRTLPCRGGEQGLFSHCLRGCLAKVPPASSRNCSQHLQRRWSLITLINSGAEGEMMFMLIQASFFSFLTLDVYSALPILCPPEPAGCWGFFSVPWQDITLVLAKQMCQQILAGGSLHATFR